jgi:hypothetical protein
MLEELKDETGEIGMLSHGDLDEVKLGLDKICGGKGKAQLFDMVWMKNG